MKATAGMLLAVAQKWVDRRPDVDPLTGAVHTDARTSGASPADQAALELALRAAGAWGGEVLVATAGPAGSEVLLREALAAGATRAVRVEIAGGATSEEVAAALAPVLAGAVLVLCGDASLDRGSGSVPAFLAGHLGAAQALGCADVDLDVEPGAQVTVERRLDGGRRERLALRTPAVVSVEGSTARLRRAPLDGVLRARSAPIEVVVPTGLGHEPAGGPVGRSAYRPRPRTLPPPSAADPRQRILALTCALADRDPPKLLLLEPGEAADRILEQLRAWGYLP